MVFYLVIDLIGQLSRDIIGVCQLSRDVLAIKTRNVIVAFWSLYCRSYWNSCLLLVKLSVVQSLS